MFFLRRGLFYFYLFVAFLLSGSEIALGDCIKFPRDSDAPSVEVCTEDGVYAFRIFDDKTTFQKEDFESRLMIAAHSWLTSQETEASLTVGSPIQIWMSVPMANPAAAQPRAIVQTSQGKLAFWFDLKASTWVFTDKETAVLGKTSYPDTFGHRPSTILVKAHENTNASDLESALVQQGAKQVIHDGNGWYVASCGLFAEKSFSDLASKSRPDVIKSAQTNSVMEWIADRQMAFSFLME